MDPTKDLVAYMGMELATRQVVAKHIASSREQDKRRRRRFGIRVRLAPCLDKTNTLSKGQFQVLDIVLVNANCSVQQVYCIGMYLNFML
jgi:hypothetical protein